MTTKAVRALFWKEYRQQIMLLVAIFLIGVLLQLSVYISSLFGNHQPTFWTVGMFVTALYAAGASAILFAREHEDNTFGFLRNLPIHSNTILIGKLIWLLGSTLILAALLSIESLIWVVASGTHDTGLLIFGVMGVAVVEALCWGLFWSTRSRTQLTALLSTFVCASVFAYFWAVLSNMLIGNGNQELGTAYANAFWLRLPFAVIIGFFAVRHACKWLYDHLETSGANDTVTEKITQEQKNAWHEMQFAPPKRGEMRWLLWHAYRQSQVSFLYLGAIFLAIITGTMVITHKVAGGDFDLAMLMLFGIVTGLIFSSSTFHRDQQYNAAAMLTNYGVSAKKIWYSRVIMFGGAYLIFMLPLIVLFLIITDNSNAEAYRALLCGESSDYSYSGMPQPMGNAFLVAVTLFGSLFCIGQIASLFSRSFVVAIAASIGSFVCVYGATFFVKILLGHNALIWAVWPMLVACLIASRMRADNWQRGRNTWQAWLPSVKCLAIPAVVIMIAIPFVRIYSVPVINLGYYVNPDVLHDERIDVDRNTNKLYQLYSHVQSARSVESLENYWMAIQDALKNPELAARYNDSPYDWNFFWVVEVVAEANKNDPQTLTRLIRFLEKMPNTRASVQDAIARTYEIEYRDSLNGIVCMAVPDAIYGASFRGKTPLWYQVLMPWEKYHVMRRLDYEYQIESQFADEIDQIIRNDKANIERLWSKSHAIAAQRHDNYTAEFLQDDSLFLRSYRPTSYWMLNAENRRRVTIITLALQVWHLEHGELPESLSQLEGSYVEKLPRTVGTGDSFLYERDPKPDANGDLAPDKYAGIPYIATPKIRLTKFEEFGGEKHYLTFAQKEK